MLKYTDKLIILIFFLCVANNSVAQDDIDVVDSTKVKFNFIPKTFRVGVDVVGLTKMGLKNDYTEVDLTTDIAIDKYFLTIDYGILESSRVGTDVNYVLVGSFIRIGPEVNFLKNDPDGNAFFFGLKYARGKSNHTLDFTYSDPIFGNLVDTRKLNSVSARWMELNTGVKVKLFQEVWLGFTGRLKFALKHDNSIVLTPYEIPGYGFSEQKVMWGFDYYVFYRIPFSKKKT